MRKRIRSSTCSERKSSSCGNNGKRVLLRRKKPRERAHHHRRRRYVVESFTSGLFLVQILMHSYKHTGYTKIISKTANHGCFKNRLRFLAHFQVLVLRNARLVCIDRGHERFHSHDDCTTVQHDRQARSIRSRYLWRTSDSPYTSASREFMSSSSLLRGFFFVITCRLTACMCAHFGIFLHSRRRASHYGATSCVENAKL